MLTISAVYPSMCNHSLSPGEEEPQVPKCARPKLRRSEGGGNDPTGF
jgi:hypothetical protein